MKRSFNADTLKQYCIDENVTIDLKCYDQKINCNSRILGKCKWCPSSFEKSFMSLIKYGPYCKECAKKNGESKRKETCVERYGTTNPFESETVREKIKETNLKKYGCVYPMQNRQILKKSVKTCLRKYGVKNFSTLRKITGKSK
jgi:hypothetical protein